MEESFINVTWVPFSHAVLTGQHVLGLCLLEVTANNEVLGHKDLGRSFMTFRCLCSFLSMETSDVRVKGILDTCSLMGLLTVWESS